jgi:hypothetical protein
VFRRLVASLLVWVGVLALAAPVVVCATMGPQTRDCCPEGEPSPCGGSEGEQGITACCAVAPVTSPSAVLEASRTSYDRPLDHGSPDPLIVALWLGALVQPQAYEAPPAHAGPPRATSATLTYLLTGRLRL